MATNDAKDLLDYYNEELSYLRTMGSLFARRYPKVAGRLDLGEEISPDPHVGRLIESFAFLTGRIQRHLDSEFPEITSALLEVLYPQYARPIPSMSIAHLQVDPGQFQTADGHTVAKGTPLVARSSDGLICRFRACYPTTIWPLEVVSAAYESTDQFRFLDDDVRTSTVLRLRLESRADPLPDLKLKRLRFYIHADSVTSFELYELIFCHLAGVVLVGKQGKAITLPPGSVKPVGFERDEDVLPYPEYSHPAYRLLQEFFAFPQKFLFFDVENLDRRGDADSLDILLLLDHPPHARRSLGPETFRLGCTPIVNLFRKTSEPIRLDQRKLEYRLIPDLHRERTTEIHSIKSVYAVAAPGEDPRRMEPFFAFNHHMEQNEQTAFWHAQRRQSTLPDVPGTDLWLSFLDLDFHPSDPPGQTVYAETLCTNRGLAEQLSAGARLQIEEAAPLEETVCLMKPVAQLPPPSSGATAWRLISQLSLNHLSLSDGKQSLQALREILRLNRFTNRPEDEKLILGIREMSCRTVYRRIGKEAWRGYCRGTEVSLLFDREMYVGSGAFLFGSVLSRFLALYTSVNSFTTLAIRNEEIEGVWKQWPPMAGEKIIL